MKKNAVLGLISTAVILNPLVASAFRIEVFGREVRPPEMPRVLQHPGRVIEEGTRGAGAAIEHGGRQVGAVGRGVEHMAQQTGLELERQVSRFGRESEKAIRQFGDFYADVCSFGQHGRNRNRERAQAQERVAEAERAAAERERDTAIRNLSGMIIHMEGRILDWTKFRDDAAILVQKYQALTEVLQPALANAVRAQNLTRQARATQREAAGDMELLVEMLRPPTLSEGNTEVDPRVSSSAWLGAFEVMNRAAQVRSMELEQYIVVIMESSTASRGQLNAFVRQVSTYLVEAQVALQTATEKVTSMTRERDVLKSQLVELQK